MIPLSALELNRPGQIQELTAREPLRTRLLDLGFVPGSQVVPLHQAPLKDPRAYWICGTLIALRRIDAASVLVEAL